MFNSLSKISLARRTFQSSFTRPAPLLATAQTTPSMMFMQQKFFSTLNDRNQSGMKPREFDYEFSQKIDNGRFPHNYHSYMKVLGSEYDTNSEQHIENTERMNEICNDLQDAVESTMKISAVEEAKLKKRGKFDARERIRKLLDRGSPFLALG